MAYQLVELAFLCELPPVQKFVLVSLCERASVVFPRACDCFSSYEDMSRRTGFKTRALEQAVAALYKKRLVYPTRNFQNANTYLINYEELYLHACLEVRRRAKLEGLEDGTYPIPAPAPNSGMIKAPNAGLDLTIKSLKAGKGIPIPASSAGIIPACGAGIIPACGADIPACGADIPACGANQPSLNRPSTVLHTHTSGHENVDTLLPQESKSTPSAPRADPEEIAATGLATTLAEVLGRSVSRKTLLKWTREARVLQFRFEAETVTTVTRWALEEWEDPFWRGRISSMRSLDKNFDVMLSQYNVEQDKLKDRQNKAKRKREVRKMSDDPRFAATGHKFEGLGKGDV